MTECQGCGAWNESHRALCVLCGTPLAETDEWDVAAELPPLPPLPDGGLASSMPSWLREAPALDLSAAEQRQGPAQLGPRVDPRTFLTDDDFPRWLRDLALREPWRTRREPATVPAQSAAGPPQNERLAPAWPHWPPSDTNTPPPVAMAPLADVASNIGIPAPSAAETDAEHSPSAGERLPAPSAPTPTREESRGRDPWETLLLVLLFLGVVIAALWALVANGVFSPGA